MVYIEQKKHINILETAHKYKLIAVAIANLFSAKI